MNNFLLIVLIGVTVFKEPVGALVTRIFNKGRAATTGALAGAKKGVEVESNAKGK